jgi:hypothetical protein
VYILVVKGTTERGDINDQWSLILLPFPPVRIINNQNAEMALTNNSAGGMNFNEAPEEKVPDKVR